MILRGALYETPHHILYKVRCLTYTTLRCQYRWVYMRCHLWVTNPKGGIIMVKEVENGKQIEKQYTQLNGTHDYSYPVVDIGNELYLKFDVNDGESIYYEMVIEHEGIILATGVSLVVWHECKSHLAIEQTEFLNWGYKDGKIGEFIHDDWSCLTSFPIDATLTDGRPMRFIEDETLNCRHCGAEKVVYGRKSDEHVRKLYGIAVSRDEPRYGCPYWHF